MQEHWQDLAFTLTVPVGLTVTLKLCPRSYRGLLASVADIPSPKG